MQSPPPARPLALAQFACAVQLAPVAPAGGVLGK